MAYLLDTNVCIALINGSSAPVRARFAKVIESREPVCVPAVSAHELWYGVAKSVQKETNAARLQKFLDGPVQLLEFTSDDARRAGEIRSRLERAGRPIGAYDVLLAGQALHRKLTLVTANTREFARVMGLVWEDWAA